MGIGRFTKEGEAEFVFWKLILKCSSHVYETGMAKIEYKLDMDPKGKKLLKIEFGSGLFSCQILSVRDENFKSKNI